VSVEDGFLDNLTIEVSIRPDYYLTAIHGIGCDENGQCWTTPPHGGYEDYFSYYWDDDQDTELELSLERFRLLTSTYHTTESPPSDEERINELKEFLALDLNDQLNYYPGSVHGYSANGFLSLATGVRDLFGGASGYAGDYWTADFDKDFKSLSEAASQGLDHYNEWPLIFPDPDSSDPSDPTYGWFESATAEITRYAGMREELDPNEWDEYKQYLKEYVVRIQLTNISNGTYAFSMPISENYEYTVSYLPSGSDILMDAGSTTIDDQTDSPTEDQTADTSCLESGAEECWEGIKEAVVGDLIEIAKSKKAVKLLSNAYNGSHIATVEGESAPLYAARVLDFVLRATQIGQKLLKVVPGLNVLGTLIELKDVGSTLGACVGSIIYCDGISDLLSKELYKPAAMLESEFERLAGITESLEMLLGADIDTLKGLISDTGFYAWLESFRDFASTGGKRPYLIDKNERKEIQSQGFFADESYSKFASGFTKRWNSLLQSTVSEKIAQNIDGPTF
jgi:hypothetical protein